MAKIGLLNLSDPVKKGSLDSTLALLKGHDVHVSDCLYDGVDARKKASVFNAWMKQDFDFIFDVSGGDLANETIRYLDLDAYQQSHAIFHGYSDLTCVLNVLAPLRPCVLFQIRNNQNEKDILNYLNHQSNDLFIGSGLGGNIRCLLKLAGTKYFPSLNQRSLYLEARSGNAYRIRSFFTQLEDMGVMDTISSLHLGEFTQLEREGTYDVLRDIVDSYALPVTFHEPFGHDCCSRAVLLEV